MFAFEGVVISAVKRLFRYSYTKGLRSFSASSAMITLHLRQYEIDGERISNPFRPSCTLLLRANR